jgi:hypothetical protein
MERHGLQRNPNAAWVVERDSDEETEAPTEPQSAA